MDIDIELSGPAARLKQIEGSQGNVRMLYP